MTIKYDNCKDCHSSCVHAGKDRKFVCTNGVSCKITTGKSQTNADRIRSMSDEELAEFIYRCEMSEIDYAKTFCDLCNGQYECDQCRLDWLKQPPKGEERKEGVD